MTDETKILTSWYKGVELSVKENSIIGGIKNSIKQFPNRDTQTVETLGKQVRKYSFQCVVSDRNTVDYFSYKKQLLSAIESTQSGQLIHPIDGRINDVYAVSYDINENFSEFGYAEITINFEVNNNTGIPQSSGNSAIEISSINDALQAQINTNISEGFSVSDKFTSNFFAAVDKVNSIIDSINSSISFTGEGSDTRNEFNDKLGKITESVNSLVKSPSSLANSVTEIFSAMNSLYDNAETTFQTFTKLFGFGDDDITIITDTASRIERKSNNDLLNGSVASAALGYCYLSAVNIEYQTTDQINQTTNSLDSQFDAVQNSTVSQSVKDAATEIRVKLIDALNEVAVTTPRVITVETLPTTVRLLAFDYYGNDDETQTIAELNGIADVSFIEGNINLVTL